MARREARSALVKLRVTEAEKEAVEVAAGAAGLSVSDYARRLLLAVPVAGVGAERAQAGEARGGPDRLDPTVPIRPPASPAEPRPLPPRDSAGLLWCPVPLCQYRAVGKSKCPIHGRDTERI